MAIQAAWFGQAPLGQYSTVVTRRVDWVGDTIKVALLGAGYTIDQDNHVFFSDVSTNEITGTGYTAGGVALGTKSTAYGAATNTVRLIAANTSWGPGASLSARYAVVYKDTGTGTTSPLMGYVDFGGLQTVSSGTLTLNWDAIDGVLRLVAA